MRAAFTSVLLLTISSLAAAQSSTDPAQVPVFRSTASLVALNVTVMDASKHYVTGLSSDDFAVFEDGVQQQVRFFESRQVPVDLILLLDCSSSMREKMDTVHQAAIGFLQTLRSDDRGAVVTFADSVNVAQALTSDRALLEAAVRNTKAYGSTALNNALYIALKKFGGAARDDVLELARRSGVNIYTIGLQSKYELAGNPGKHRYFSESQYAMKTLAQETGAESFFPTDIVELRDIYASISRELSSQYSIGYSPSNGRLDGRFRRVVVQVVSRPELRPKARSGYTAAASGTESQGDRSR
jgi:Ca-activated chloride channel homolog